MIVAFVVVAIATGIVAFFWVRDLVAGWTMTGVSGEVPGINQGGSNPSGGGNQPGASGGKPAPGEAGGPAPAAWDGNSRITLLVMGLDYRSCDDAQFTECDTGGAARTDSMMLVTVDPLSKSAGMLSIPRDMWVQIPGAGYGKINTAYFIGAAEKLPGGGPGLAMETVEQFLGVPVPYYAQIDFSAFVRMIDEIGGLKLDIQEPITLTPIGTRERTTLQPGKVTLPGNLVLAYARNRSTENGDFDRSARQQQVILAVRDRILDFNMLPTLVAKAPALYSELQSGVKTNLTLDQIIRLAWLMQQIPKENIKQGVIGPPKQVDFGTSPDGTQAVLIPIPDQIRLLRDEIFATNPGAGPAAVSSNPEELVKQEAARVVVKNGSTTAGMAGRVAEYLRNKSVNITGEGNADQVYSESTIIDYSGKPYTVRMLADLLGLDVTRIVNRYDPDAQVDIEIILGTQFNDANLK